MRSTWQRRFLFTDDAVGLMGQITSPRGEPIEGQAVASLAVGGGLSTSRVNGFRYGESGEFVSIDEATATVFGRKVEVEGSNPRSRVAETSATVSVRGFNLLNVVRAGVVTARIAAAHPEAGPSDSTITILGTGFEDLTIAGRRVAVIFNECLFELQKFSDLGENDDAFKLVRDCWKAQQRRLPRQRQAKKRLPTRKSEWIEFLRNAGPILCPIVKEIRGLPPGVEAKGHILYIPSFGEVNVGEMLLTPTSRRLTMLRFILGCAWGGCVGCGDACDNGSWYP